MCGILGQITFKGHAPHPQLKLISHRGPDGNGEWTNASGTVYFGHTRLAILDPTPTGAQPMTDASGRFTITFNGEIYNHLDLRLLLPGIHWRGSSDTETIIELFARKGMETLPLLRGMFAFAIHDTKDDTVVIVRDRLGIKPLWTKAEKNYFRFASEVRPLLNHGEIKPNQHALSEYIGFGHFPGNGDIFEGVQSIAPGGWVRVTPNAAVEKGNWWPMGKLAHKEVHSKKDAVDLVKQLVTKVIEEHLISDVGVGAFLSGGIDSSIVTLVAGKALGKNLRTFTVGFPQGSFDERSVARLVAKQAGAEHSELEVSEDTCLTWVNEAVARLDLPSVDAINTYIVSKAVRDSGVKVALSGLGGDELFGGYSSFKDIPLLTWLGSLPASVSEKVVGVMPRKLKEKLQGLSTYSTTELAVARRRFTSVENLSAMGFGHGTPFMGKVPEGLDTMGLISWSEIQGYMIPMLLRDSDQMSMAVGLEIRVPFVDHVLVEEVLTLPQQYKKGKGVKPLLVEAFMNVLPREVYDRPKQGFALPMEDWIRGPLAGLTKSGIEAAADLLGLTEPIRQKESFDQGHLHWTRVWHWCVLGQWLMNRQSAARVLEPTQ